MRRIEYLLKDAAMVTRARVTCMENEDPVLEPWMTEAVKHRGWFLTKGYSAFETTQHGGSNWQSIAEQLSEALRMAVTDEDGEDLTEEATEQAVEAIHERAIAALDAYDLAVMELSMHQTTEEPERGGAEGG